MMHRDVEVYVDFMIVKSQDRTNHLAVLDSLRGSKVQIEVKSQEVHLWSDFWEITGTYG